MKLSDAEIKKAGSDAPVSVLFSPLPVRNRKDVWNAFLHAAARKIVTKRLPKENRLLNLADDNEENYQALPYYLKVRFIDSLDLTEEELVKEIAKLSKSLDQQDVSFGLADLDETALPIVKHSSNMKFRYDINYFFVAQWMIMFICSPRSTMDSALDFESKG
jgi:hypothetical protein